MSRPAEGLLLVDKPTGPTSHDVVALVRRKLGLRRVGHTGTLDPLASGLLLVLVGRATRLARFVTDGPKVYTGVFEFGRTSTTDDVTGEILTEHRERLPAIEPARAAAAELIGTSLQRPPSYSARKVGGQRLYRLARRGVRVEVPPREIRVDRFEIEPVDERRTSFRVSVSAGTYVRALVRDLGERLGCGALLIELRRTSIGPLDVGNAVPLEPEPEDAALREAVLGPEDMPLDPPTVRLSAPEQVARFASGGKLARTPGSPGAGMLRVLGPDGRMLGVAEALDGVIHPRVVLVSSSDPGPCPG